MTLLAATRWLSVLARLGLAAVWLTSGWLKAVDPLQTVVAVRAYQLLPEAAITPFATVLPFAEIGLRLLLLAGVGVRVTALLSALMLGVFLVGVASAWARGLSSTVGVSAAVAPRRLAQPITCASWPAMLDFCYSRCGWFFGRRAPAPSEPARAWSGEWHPESKPLPQVSRRMST